MRRHLLAWFVVGALMGAFVQWSQVRELGDGDVAALLSVGATSDARRYFEKELGSIPLVPGGGHDGQSSYIVARDPWAAGDAWRDLDHAGYRYRRMLYPAVAGGLGLLSPRATVYGLALIALVGMGLAAAALADLVRRYGTGLWVVLGIIANPGLWLSVKLLTPDALAMGLALAGVASYLRGSRRVSWVLLGAAALTKEPYLLFSLGLAGWLWARHLRKEGVLITMTTAAPLVLWSTRVSLVLGGGFSPRGNLAVPGIGIFESASGWTGNGDLLLSLIALMAAPVAGFAAWLSRRPLLIWLTWPWIAVAILSSGWVWDLGNNAIRAFLPLWALAFLGIGVYLERRLAAAPVTVSPA